MGVVGVLAMVRDGGGLRFRSGVAALCSCSAAILAAVGTLSGMRFMGGKRSGCKFFLLPLVDATPFVIVWFCLS